MKRIARLKTTAALILSLGVAGAHAQPFPVNMTLSGSAAPSTVDLGTGTPASEYDLTDGRISGSFTFRAVTAGPGSPQPSSPCSGLYIPTTAGQGVFRFEDGRPLKFNLTEGSDCINLAAKQARCTRTFEITGGTGPFKNASGKVTLTMDLVPVSGDKPLLFAVTGTFTGIASSLCGDQDGNEVETAATRPGCSDNRGVANDIGWRWPTPNYQPRRKLGLQEN